MQKRLYRSAIAPDRRVLDLPGAQLQDKIHVDRSSKCIKAAHGRIYPIMTFQEPEKQIQIIRILKYSIRAAVSTPVVYVYVTELLDGQVIFPLANLNRLYYHNRRECRHFHPADGSGAFQMIRRLRQVHPH